MSEAGCSHMKGNSIEDERLMSHARQATPPPRFPPSLLPPLLSARPSRPIPGTRPSRLHACTVHAVEHVRRRTDALIRPACE